MADIQSFTDIENLWKTRADFARAINTNQEVVRQWQLRRSIPASYWCRIAKACAAIGEPITFELLAELADIDKRNKKSPEALRRVEA